MKKMRNGFLYWKRTVERERTYKNIHLLVHAIVQQEVMTHPDSMRLHRMPWSVIKVSNLRCHQTNKFVTSKLEVAT